jgi:hypothetical protein
MRGVYQENHQRHCWQQPSLNHVLLKMEQFNPKTPCVIKSVPVKSAQQYTQDNPVMMDLLIYPRV